MMLHKRTTDNVLQFCYKHLGEGYKRQIQFCKYHEKKLNLMQIHLHEVKIMQIHNARPEFVKNITAINQSESSILI